MIMPLPSPVEASGLQAVLLKSPLPVRANQLPAWLQLPDISIPGLPRMWLIGDLLG